MLPSRFSLSPANSSPATKLGYYTPFAIIGTVAITVSCGLLTALKPHSSNVTWIMYQILGGVARGMVAQQPLTAVQAALPPSRVSVGTAFLMFSQVLSGALFISFGQTVFSNQLGPALARYAPDVDAQKLLAVGATNFRSVVDGADVGRVVQAYNLALTRVFVSLGRRQRATGRVTANNGDSISV